MSIFWHVFFTSRERDLQKCTGILPKCIFDSFTLWRDSLMCNMTHLCVTCLIYVWRDSSIGACAHCVEFSHFGTASLQHTSESCKNAKNTQSIQINLNKTRSGNPRSASMQSSKPCTVLQYPSRTARLAKIRRSLQKCTLGSVMCAIIPWCVTWLLHMWRVSFSQTCKNAKESCKNVHLAQSYVLSSLDVWHDSFICDISDTEYSLFYRALLQKRPVTWLICDVSHLARLANMRRSLAKMHTWCCRLTHWCVTWSIHIWRMGWLRSVGSIKL